MSDRLHIDPPEALHQAGLLHTLATDLAGAIGPVLDGLTGLGDYCGTDPSGQSFAASYQPHVDRLEPALTDAVGEVSELSDALRLAATNLSDLDQRWATLVLRSIGDTIPADPAF